MIRRYTPLETLAGVFLIIALVAIIGVLVLFGIRLFNLSRPAASHLLTVPDNFATIQEAINAAVPGDIVRVRAGTYIENLTLSKPVSLVAESFDQINPVNNTVIIDGGGTGPAILIPAGLTQMPAIQGFVIQNATDGIRAQSNFVAENNYFHSSGIQVNYQMGAGGINRNNVYFGSTDDAIHMDDIKLPVVIENNRILYAGDDGIEINLQNATAPAAAVDIAIRNNMIVGSTEDGIQFVDFANDPQETNRRFEIRGNLIANSKKAGIGLMPNANTAEDYSGADTVEAIHAFNNTFYGNDYAISGGDNLVVFNSIFVNSITHGLWKVQGPAGAKSVVAYSLFYNNPVDADQSTVGTGNLLGQDPLFQALPNPGPDGTWGTLDDDFSGLVLQSTSPAIDKGVAQYVANGEPIPATPITGFAGAAPDLGWREFGSPLFFIPNTGVTATSTFTPAASLTPLPTQTPFPTFTLVPPPTTAIPPTAFPPSPLPSPTVIVPTAIPPTSTVAPAATVPTSSQVMITKIVPNMAQVGSTVNLTITGTGFVNGAVVTFEGGLGPAPQITSTTVANTNTIVITVNVVADTSQGNQIWDVRVTNPDKSTAILPDSFRVVVS
jgi:hypothetical protein